MYMSLSNQKAILCELRFIVFDGPPSTWSFTWS